MGVLASVNEEQKLTRMSQVREYRVAPGRTLFSANHDEVVKGYTTDVYFVKTREILESMGLADKEVTAEIFPRRAGVFAGLPECINLLKGTGVKVWALPEGEAFEAKEPVMRITGEYSEFGIYETALLASSRARAAGRRPRGRCARRPETGPSSASVRVTCIQRWRR